MRRAIILFSLAWSAAAAWLAPRRGLTPVRRCASGDDDLETLKKVDLVARCKARGLGVSGTKAALVARLRARARADDEALAVEEAIAVPPLVAPVDLPLPAVDDATAPAAAATVPPLFDDDDADAAPAPPPPSFLESAEARDPRLREAAADRLLTAVAAAGAAVDPGVLAAEREALLADGGAAFKAVAERFFLAASPFWGLRVMRGAT